MQENERLQRQTSVLHAEKERLTSNPLPSPQNQLLEEQNAKLLAENRRLVEERDKIALDNRELRGIQPAADPDFQQALIQKLQDKIAALKEKADEDSLAYASCGNCRHAHGIRDVLCSGCFMSASAHGGLGHDRKGSTKITYYGWDSYGDTVSVNDSDDERRPTDKSYYYEDS